MARYFDRESADALMPDVEPLLREIQSLREQLAEVEERAAGLQARTMGNGHLHEEEIDAVLGDARRIGDEIGERLRQIDAMGVLVKDLDAGLIDFPALRDGREVYLCWRLGEGSHIAWWHEIEAGFAGRQPLTD